MTKVPSETVEIGTRELPLILWQGELLERKTRQPRETLARIPLFNAE
jgi:hypothetical protein